MAANKEEMNWSGLDRFSFGDSSRLADELLALVLSGQKTATCWSVQDGMQTSIGKRMVVCDGSGRPRAVVETISLEQRSFQNVDQAFARKEGEGDLTLEWWREAHMSYFKRNGGFDPSMLLWCEEFKLVKEIALHD
ncbi:ASCH domain protein (plasmid) [Ochrobactrum quorumnocens]|uniref:ASCH domain protein n=1 Tax=Ochrobactrum quorumnocens TaxID=271865 RepID=A0A248UPG3_9HYPH|nr:ASCH domain-containing protein [[Ochrobactrum] quorumnocens]ASV88534.1 ASCH domain protein [[Ochrobactrum] quorumnocens]